MDYKFEVGDVVCILPNFVEMWEKNRQTFPLPHVIEHIQGMIGKPCKIEDRMRHRCNNLYNIDGFAFEEYTLAAYDTSKCVGM